MATILSAAWFLVQFLKYIGLAIALLGVVIFGWYFVSINACAARSSRNDVSPEAWRDPGAIRGAKLLGIGIVV